jgi:5-formyltetrahydrofolate cyclo-ligase
MVLRGPPPDTVSAPPFGRLTRDAGREAKDELRARMRRTRGALSPEERSRLAHDVTRRLFALPEMASAGTVLLFYSFGSEVATREMAERVWTEGKRLLLPYVDGAAMEAAAVHAGDELVRAPYGAREPAVHRPVDPEEVDVVVAPGLAFDRQGHRLGYGGGYYDRYLARLRPDAVRVGIGFAVQLVDQVPAGPADQRVDLVVTDREIVDCRGG